MSDKKITELPIAASINATDVSVLVSNDTNYQFAFSTLLQFISTGLSVGANITFGTTLPQNTTGKNGDVFINTSAGCFAQKSSGTWAVVYTLPSSGGTATDGTVLYGAGVPASGTGNNNDTYINTATGIFYKKSSGAWAQVFSMQTGPAGPQGASGTNGTNGTNGKTILNGTTNPSDLSTGTDGDFYINTSTFTFFGPKAGGVWPVGTSLAGSDGQGVPTGGATGQVLTKIDGTDFHTQWATPSGGGSVSGLTPNQILFGKSDGAIAQDSTLQFDAGTKSLYLGDVPDAPASGGTLHCFGDSITVGTGASSGANRWTTLLASWLGMTEANHGVSGSTLEEQTPSDPSGAASMRSRISDIPTYVTGDLMIFMYGINDTRFVSANYNATNFQIDYEAIIDAAIVKGWPSNRILITSTQYVDPATYSSPGDGGTPNPSLSRQQGFNAAALITSVTKSTMYSEIFDYMAERGGIYNQSGFSGIHPGDPGYLLLALKLYSTIITNVYANGQGLATSRVVELLNVIVNTKYVVPDGSPLLGIDEMGSVGRINTIPSKTRMENPQLTKGLQQIPAQQPTIAPADIDWLLKMDAVIRSVFDGQPDWQGYIQLMTGGQMIFGLTYGGGAFIWNNGDGTNQAMKLSRYSQLILDGATTADNTPGDIVINPNTSLNASVGGFKAGFIPFGTSNNFSFFFNNLSTGKIKIQMSLGTGGSLNDTWQFNADGSFESVIAGQGVTLMTPDGTKRYKITIDNSGNLVTTLQ